MTNAETAAVHAPDALIEGNLLALWGTVAGRPSTTLSRESDCLTFTSELSHPFGNGVVGTSFAETSAERRTDEVLARMRAHGHPFLWWVGPGAPAGLEALLTARDLQPAGLNRGMMADLTQSVPAAPTGGNVTICRVDDEGTLADFERVVGESFQLPEPVVQLISYIIRSLGYAPDALMHSFVAYLEGEPVGSSCVFYGAGTSGIYCVGVTEAARRKGVGAAVTRAAMEYAQNDGFETCILHATPMGQGVYEALGFVPHGAFRTYLWTPEGQ